MPDASASNITSFIAWFVVIVFLGEFLFKLSLILEESCLDEATLSNYNLLLAFLSTICMSIILITNSLISPKWFIIEPKSPQSLKTFWQVLKFAVKHKAPINRSALTYWQEDIPSRIDLGKSSYGGPFTNKQVEDVKTTLRLLCINITFFLVILSVSWVTTAGNPNETIIGLNWCTTDVAYLFS